MYTRYKPRRFADLPPTRRPAAASKPAPPHVHARPAPSAQPAKAPEVTIVEVQAKCAALFHRVRALERDSMRLASALVETHLLKRAHLCLADFADFRITAVDSDFVTFRASYSNADLPEGLEKYTLVQCGSFFEKAMPGLSVKTNELVILEHLPFHPNVITYYTKFVDSFSAEQRAQLAEGTVPAAPSERPTVFYLLEHQPFTLCEFLVCFRQSGGLTRANIARILLDVAAGVQHLLEHGVVHNELSFINIAVELDEDNPRSVRRAVLTDLQHAHRIDEHGICFVPKTPDGEPPRFWEDLCCIAPELLSQYNHATSLMARLDYSGQPVFQLCMLAVTMLMGDDSSFVDNYPSEYLDAASGRVVYSDTDLPVIPDSIIEPEVAQLFEQGLACNPRHRPKFEDFVSSLRTLL